MAAEGDLPGEQAERALAHGGGFGFVAEYVGRFFIGVASPPIALERPPGAVANVIFPLLGAALLALSLRRKTNRG